MMLHTQSLSSGLATRAHRPLHVVASMGGRGSWGGSDSGLILGPNGGSMGRPGAPPAAPGRLIIPGQPGFNPNRGQQRPPIGLSDDAAGSGVSGVPVPNKYRPPPGFMNDNVQDPALAARDPQEMISKLRSHAGAWHELAKLLPILYAKGFDTNTVAELTGVNPVDQNLWVVAGTVYDSVAATGNVPASVLAYFDQGGEELLYHFRFLPAERRAAAAQYIVSNNLDAQQSEVLARAMKEWERRPGERQGFSNGPGDCMAFKYLRDAIECRFPEEAAEKLQLAFQAAETEEAAARLTDYQDNELAAAATTSQTLASKAVLQVLRLSQDELGFRPLAQVSALQDLSISELLDAPSTSQEGAFGTFNMPATDRPQKWVALPQWKALALARHPVAIPLADCAAEPSVLAASRVKTEEEKKRLTGAGLLVVDTIVSDMIDPSAFYLVYQADTQRLALVEGAKLIADDGSSSSSSSVVSPIAAVLFLCRPPNRESTITSSELLQL